MIHCRVSKKACSQHEAFVWHTNRLCSEHGAFAAPQTVHVANREVLQNEFRITAVNFQGKLANTFILTKRDGKYKHIFLTLTRKEINIYTKIQIFFEKYKNG